MPLMFCATVSTSLDLFASAASLNFCKIYRSTAQVFVVRTAHEKASVWYQQRNPEVPESGSVLRRLSLFVFSSFKNFAEMFVTLNSYIQPASDGQGHDVLMKYIKMVHPCNFPFLTGPAEPLAFCSLAVQGALPIPSSSLTG